MSRYRLSRQAVTDLDEIWDYIGIEKNRPTAAKRVIAQLYATFAKLADHPELGMRRDDLREHVRMFCPRKPARNYAVFFQSMPDGIEVITIIHAARDFPQLFGSETT